MEWMLTPEGWIAFLTLTALELVLGIDNIVFVLILTNKLPEKDQPKARFLGLGLAMVMRILLLFCLSWMMRLTAPLFSILGHAFSGRDLILIIGGLFLLAKATHEIHDKLEAKEGHASSGVAPTLAAILFQVILLDMVFSLDSVITAVGMVNEVSIMVPAVVIAVIFMMLFAGWIDKFLDEYPTVKMLALSFLLLVGVTLMADGLGHHIPKGYIYFSMAFSILVVTLNIRMMRARRDPMKLRHRYAAEEAAR